jgi:tRNA threonylcarbamoyladenosine biosynthesis protein TsaB
VPDFAAPLILSLETATRTGSVALTRGSQLLALRAGDAQTSHSMKLLHNVEEILKDAGASLQEVELYAIANGPGSFTGLRIGLATIKSFAATLSRSCVGIPTLAAVAFAAGLSKRTLAMIPAGRGEVFAQILSVEESGEVTPLCEAVHQAPEKLLDGVIHFDQLKLAGEGVRQHDLLIKTMAEKNGISLVYAEESDNEGDGEPVKDVEKRWLIARPVDALATYVAALAYLHYKNGSTLKPEQLQAIYVRPSDAELNAQER